MTGIVTMPDGSPVNYDGATTLAFKLSFMKLPMTEMFIQECNIPGISLSPVNQQSPLMQFSHPGEKLNYEDFQCTFLVDKNFKNYKEVIDWMTRISTKAGRSQEDEYENPVLSIGPTKSIRFYNAFPISISGLSLKSNETNVVYLTSTATFRYDYFEFL